MHDRRCGISMIILYLFRYCLVEQKLSRQNLLGQDRLDRVGCILQRDRALDVQS